jgi:hypothetical protein
MAGVFSPREAQGIQGTEVRGGVAPSGSVLGGVRDALAIAAPALTKAHAKSLQEDLTTQTSALQQALQAQQNPSLAKSLFSKEALENPVTKAAFSEYQQINLAAQQGKLSPAYAMERLLVIQHDAIANAPEFEQELRAAMIQATGQDPQKAMYARLLSESRAGNKQTAEEKANFELDKEATRLGMTRAQVQHMAVVDAKSKLLDDELSLKKASGEYNLLDLSADVNNQAGGIMLDLVGTVRAMNEAQGGLTPDDKRIVTLKANAAYAAASAKLRAGSKGISSARIAEELAGLDEQRKTVETMIDVGLLETLSTSNNTLNKSRLEGTIMSMHEYAIPWLVGNKPAFLKMVEYQEKTKGDNAAKGLAGDINPTLAGFNTLMSDRLLLKQFKAIGDNTPAVSAEDKRARPVAASIILSAKGGSEESYATAVRELDTLGLDLKWLINATKSPTLKAAVAQTQVTVTSGLANEYLQLANNPAINAAAFKFANGNLTYADLGGGGSGILGVGGQAGAGNSLAAADAADFVKRFNTANRISAAHAATGVLPSTRYSGVQDYWQVVSTSGKAVVAGVPADTPAATTTIKWGRDANGKAVKLN